LSQIHRHAAALRSEIIGRVRTTKSFAKCIGYAAGFLAIELKWETDYLERNQTLGIAGGSGDAAADRTADRTDAGFAR
jgi:hypothetical protein